MATTIEQWKLRQGGRESGEIISFKDDGTTWARSYRGDEENERENNLDTRSQAGWREFIEEHYAPDNRDGNVAVKLFGPDD